MTLFDDNTSHNPTATVEHEPTTSNDVPAQPETTAPQQHTEVAQPQTQSQSEEKPASAPTEDFASALETFTTEAEEAVGEDRVIRGTVLKLTPTHVVVDIGAKSEGMLPISEVMDHEGKPRFQPGQEIDVMREKGETEEGYINLSHQKAQRLHAWDEIEKAHNEKKP